jgi:DNA-binding transcriptional regulator YiaG
MEQTAYHRNGTFLAPAITFTLLLGVGTGGEYTSRYHQMREQGFVLSKPRDRTVLPSVAATVAADIEHIKSTLNVTMTELAKCLGVSRQAPYNWIAGSPIKTENVVKLNSLKAAADMIAAEDIPASPLLLQRKLPGGKNLLEAISSGVDGGAAAHSFLEMYRKETEQRRVLNERFANRRSQSRDVPGHGIPPSLVEES